MNDLKEQIKIATNNFKHFTQMGDVNNANKLIKQKFVKKSNLNFLDLIKFLRKASKI